MGEHIEIAKRFVHEQLQKRDDIIGVLLVGSVAREEETAFSDIDLRLIMKPAHEAPLHRHGIDAWQGGLYIDATPVSYAGYAELDQVLAHPISANDLNSGRILYDPTGVLTRMQHETQAVFMAPQSVAVRVKPVRDQVAERLRHLEAAIDAGDHCNICLHAGRIVFGCAIIPLLQHGIAPSSTRHLIQLGHLSASLRNRLCELEGSLHMESADVLALFPIFSRLNALSDTSKQGHLPEYMRKKALWMTRNGYHREALHTIWINNSFSVHDCLHREDSSAFSEVGPVVQDWLRAVHWDGKDILAGKLKDVTCIWEEIHASIDGLLSQLGENI